MCTEKNHVLLHNTGSMPSRLIIALVLSLVLHGGFVAPDVLKHLNKAATPVRPALQARLQLPPLSKAPPAPEPDEPLLKNTLEPEEKPAAPEPTPAAQPAKAPAKNTPAAAKREIRAAQRKISELLFYPPEAVARGIEGEVRLILTLSADGAVDDVNLAASSGHPILDNAAIKAAYAMGRLSGAARAN